MYIDHDSSVGVCFAKRRRIALASNRPWLFTSLTINQRLREGILPELLNGVATLKCLMCEVFRSEPLVLC